MKANTLKKFAQFRERQLAKKSLRKDLARLKRHLRHSARNGERRLVFGIDSKSEVELVKWLQKRGFEVKVDRWFGTYLDITF